MNGRYEIQADGQQDQGSQAEQEFNDKRGSFEHGQDYNAFQGKKRLTRE
jgi:hypothetical protein